MRRSFERVADLALVAVTAAAGLTLALAPFMREGLVLGGSACGGGGNEQRCTGIARQASLIAISPRAWVFVTVGVLCVVLSAAALVVSRRRDGRLLLGLAVVVLAFTALIQAEQVHALLGPEGGGTWGRTLPDWGPFLSPELRDLREDALRRYEGRPTEPGGPLYEREQILPDFSARKQDGWRLLYASVLVLFFTALIEATRRIVRRPTLAFAAATTFGLVLWAMIVDRASPCHGESECWDGILTILAVGAAAIGWGAYLAGIFLGRVVERIRLRS